MELIYSVVRECPSLKSWPITGHHYQASYCWMLPWCCCCCRYGYPDSTYLKRVREELAAKGIKSSSPPAVTSDDSKKTQRIDSPLMSDVSLKTGTKTTDRYPPTSHLLSSKYYNSLPSTLNSGDGSSHLRATGSGSYAGSGSSQATYSSLLSYPSTVSRSSGAGGYNGRSGNTFSYKQWQSSHSNFNPLGLLDVRHKFL